MKLKLGREDLELTISGVKPFCFIDKHVHPKQYQTAISIQGVHSVVHRGKGLVTVCRVENKHLQLTYGEIMNNVHQCLDTKRKALRELFGYDEVKQE